jgi:hypothetical protein
MLYGEILKMRRNLEQVNFIQTANSKFLYAVARNKAKCDSIIKTLNTMIEPTQGIKDYRKELDELNRKYAERDVKGTIEYVYVQNSRGGQDQMYRKIVGEGNPESEYEKTLEILTAKYKDVISEHDFKIEKYNDHLRTEVSKEDSNFLQIEFKDIPSGLHPAAMDGCIPFIMEPTISEPEKK